MYYTYFTHLRHGVELHHSISQGLSIASQRRNNSQHCTIECSIDLGQGGRTWIVHIYDWNVTQESENRYRYI